MNFELNEVQKSWQAKARKFAQEDVFPIARKADKEGRLPEDIFIKMGKHGFLSGPISKDYGGQELDYVSFALINEEIGKACSSTRGFIATQVCLVALCINHFGSEEQKKMYLPKLVSGEIISCYALTEPNAGTDAGNIQTTAIRDGDYYIINGEKQWISNGNIANLCIIFVSTNRDARHKGITAFLLDPNTEGVHRDSMEGRELGHCASDHARVVLKDVKIHKDNMLGNEGEGFTIAMGALNYGRLSVAAGAVGLAQGCLDASIKFARERVQFDKPIGTFQLIQSMIAEMHVETDAARLITYRAAEQKDRGIYNTVETSMAKYYATEVAAKVADKAIQIHGSYGYTNVNPVERFFRDIKGAQIYEGTNQIQRIIIGREIVNLKK